MTDWNKGQLEVLESIDRDHNILVSAAAGSGKTAVLVERIIRSIEQGKCGIDEILVMTFTRAAAAQMKGKIITGLENRAYDSGNPELLKQLNLAGNADISTIDSFCNRVVKENFQLAGMDPGYSVMDNGESVLLKEEILDGVMEQLYRDPGFRKVAEIYTRRAYDDSVLRELIFYIDRKADSFADPDAWLAGCTIPTGEDAVEKALAMPWSVKLLEEKKRRLEQAKKDYEKLRDRYSAVSDPAAMDTAARIYAVLDSDAAVMQCGINAGDLLKLNEAISGRKATFSAASYKKVYSGEEIDALKAERDAIGKRVDKLKLPYGREGFEEELRDHAVIINELIRAVRLFRQELGAEKKRRKRYDFSDIAHAAYRVLFDTEKNEITAAGRAFSEKYRYIYIDEYQDGSDIQEKIMNSVARYENGAPSNIFMVGDVKQSIYRFREAKPELFLEKERLYNSGELPGEVIYLNRNYRSRTEILDAVNFFFKKLMRKDFGGIAYDEKVQLNPPEDTEDEPDDGFKPELILADPGIGDEEAGPAPDDQVLEARLIAERIKQLVTGSCSVQYRDIVILRRGVKGCGKMLREFERLGIPVQLEDPKAYFDAEEVLVLLSVLQVIDNARQDIPYAAALHSVIGGCTDEELTRLAMQRAYRGEALYDTAERLIKDGRAGEKLIRLHEMIAGWKKEALYLSIAQLIDRILTDTEYLLYAASLPHGGKRQSNLMRLMVKAEDFEKAGNHGLFAFLRYIEKCRIHEADFGASGGFAEGSNSVRICTMHSSKGLEYPVVFLAGLGTKYNTMDQKKPVAVSARYGIAPNHVRRIGKGYIRSSKGICRDAVNRLENLESVHEELRLLYVGMTRAKDRLIMTGVKKDAEECLSPVEGDGELSYQELTDAASNLDFIIDVIRKNAKEAEKYVRINIRDKDGLMSAAAGTEEKKTGQGSGEKLPEELYGLYDKIRESYMFSYPYRAAVETGTKVSVSEIKHEAMERKGVGISEELHPDKNSGQKKEGTGGAVSAADYGTAVHKLMELLPFGKMNSRTEMEEELGKELDKPFFTPELRKRIRVGSLADFYSDEPGSLFARMRKADREGKLYKEQQFLIGLPGSRLEQEIPVAEEEWEVLRYKTDETVVMQGVIDGFFLETDEEGREYAVLMDYKTDRVNSPEDLIRRYSAQLSLYKETLEGILKLPVREVWLYGFSGGLGEIRME